MTDIELRFQIQFMSDWHVGAGYGASSDASAVLERDAQDNLVINGTTLKGIFRDALYDLSRNLGLSTGDVQAILGVPGIDSRWRFSAAQTNKVTTDSTLVSGVRVDPRFRRAEDKKFFNREIGSSQPTYTFTVSGSIPDEYVIEDVEWLVAAASYIERMGGQRRRGRGRCKTSLVDTELHHAFLDSFGMRRCGETGEINRDAMANEIIVQQIYKPTPDYTQDAQRYRIMLYTERPLVISQKPESGNVYKGRSIIPGQTLRGALASLANPNQLDANEYDIFKQLFILGGLRLSDLVPLKVDKDKVIPIVQLPMGLQRVEGEDDAFTSVFDQLAETKSYSGWVSLEDNMPKAKGNMPTMEAHPHIAINPDLKRASDGALYTYEAIPAGTYYIGELYFADKKGRDFAELIKVNPDKPFEMRIGKGRHRSYGLCRAIITPIIEDDVPVSWIHASLKERLKGTADDTLLVTLASDTILQDTWGRFYRQFDVSWLAEMFGCSTEDFEITSPNPKEDLPEQVVRTTLIQSFDARSGVPRWRDQALIQGSTVHLRFKSGKRPAVTQLQQIEVTGVGLRRNEGYGRVVFNHPAHFQSYIQENKMDVFAEPVSLIPQILPHISNEKSFDAEWRDMIDEQINRHDIRHEQINRIISMELMSVISLPQKTLFVELENMISSTKKSIDERHTSKDTQNRYYLGIRVVKALLNKLYQSGRYDTHWRKAIVILIERLLQAGGKQDAR